MTSRTNRHLEGQNQSGTGKVSPSDVEQRRRLAVKRYLDGDLIESICHEMGCSKSWLYKWKNRYQATEPTWFRPLSSNGAKNWEVRVHSNTAAQLFR